MKVKSDLQQRRSRTTSRRDTLAALTAGSGVVLTQWKPPVIGQAILPAHAEMSVPGVMAQGFEAGTTSPILVTFPNQT